MDHGFIDWDDAFDNSGYVPGADGLLDLWSKRAADFRTDTPCTLDLAYGPQDRSRLDLFVPDAPHDPHDPRGLVMFVHGGYWQMLDKSYWSHLAAGPLQQGYAVAIPSYTLAPEARIAEITHQIAQALAVVAERVSGPIHLAGHSAGGHLVSRLSCAGVLAGPLAKRLARVVSISGVHDLRPLLATQMNTVLRLDAQEAQAESPALQTPLPHITFTAWVGASERPEFLRQTRLITEAWSRKGARAHDVYDPGHHHFSVIDALTDPGSALTQAVLG
jgi:acetyl esterase/lipase